MTAYPNIASTAAAPATVLHTARLVIRHMTPGDAAFMLGLLNDPAWLQYIGDRGVRTLDEARRYILDGPVAMVRRLGFGFHIVTLKESGVPIGVCGLAKRDYLDDVDIGYAIASPWRGEGYAHEAASAMLAHALDALKFKRIVATVRAENTASIGLLHKLGLRCERAIAYPGSPPDLQLFAIETA